jgi:hypothetical protein
MDGEVEGVSVVRLRCPWFGLCVLLGLLAGCGGDAKPDRDAGDRPEDSEQPPRDAGGGGGGSDSRDASSPGSDPDATTAHPDAGVDAGSVPWEERDAGPLVPTTIGPLTTDTHPQNQDLDLFGAPGHRFWIEVDEEQLRRMNEATGLPEEDAGEPDIYEPGGTGGEPDFPEPDGMAGEPGAPTYANHVVVEDVVSGRVADYGKVEVKIIGVSTRRRWTPTSIPSLRLDSNEFERGKKIGTFEHMRLNNSVVGSIFREYIANHIFRELDYPAPRSSYAFLGSNVWGTDVWVPMTLMEVYKFRFCNDNLALLGGDCVNMWEFDGDITGAIPADACQVSTCDNARLQQLQSALAGAGGPGFKAALDPYVAWDHFHKYQCLNWIMWVGDDAIHDAKNNLIVERDDGRLIWAPYSIDISAGQEWFRHVPLTGVGNPIAAGCQREPACWADTIAACEQLVMRFDALNPEQLVDETVELLTDLGMMRDGDDARAAELRQWFVTRQAALPDELENFRYQPDVDGNCPGGYGICNDGGCGTPAQCADRPCVREERWCESLASCIALYEDCP